MGINSNTYLGTVNNPDIIGVACNYNPLSLNLGQAINYLHTLSEPLLPPACQFNTLNNVVATDFVCRPDGSTHTNISLNNIVNNPCNDTLTFQIISVTYGTALVVGNNIQYIQPDYYTPQDTILFVACNNSGQCDTSETVIYMNYVGPPSPIITCINDTLYSSSSANNHWLLNGNPIPGATGVFYVPTQTGFYSININVGLCNAESAPFYYELSSVFETNATSNKLEVFPNPGKNILYIKGFLGEEMQILDLSGKKVFETKNNGKLDISVLIKGTYLLKVTKDNKSYCTKFVKE